MSVKQITPTSKKREALHVDSHVVNGKKALAQHVLKLLVEYKESYVTQVKENVTIDEIVKAINQNDFNGLIAIKHKKEKQKLQENFTNLNDKEVLEILATQSKEEINNLIVIANKIKAKLRGSGLAIENFILNDNFVINSKVEGRIKNMATIYCTSQKQKELRDLSIKLSKLVKGALKTGLLHHNRLGTVAENIIDLNTGEIKYQYIMRC